MKYSLPLPSVSMPFRRTLSYTGITILFICFFCSCFKTKSLPACNGNCADVVFSGTVYDLSANAPLAGDDINIYLNPYTPGALIQPDNYLVAHGKTGSDGAFTFRAQYDTVKFNSSTAIISAAIPNGYIQYPQQTDPMAEATSSGTGDFQFGPTDFAAFSHLSFGFFQKTLLQIHLHRTTTFLKNYDLLLDLSNNGVSSTGGFILSDANKDTTITAYAGANVFTVITATKAISDTSYSTAKDSIKCTKNGPNSIDFYY